jgi:putative inorganic carbon (HCO3(-)) transporter
MIESNLLFGVGINNYTQTAGDYDFTLERVTSEFPRPVHNMYLLVLAEIGIFGFLAFMAFLLGMLIKGFGVARAPDPEVSTYGLALTMGMAAVLLQGFVDFFYPSMNFTFWFIAGAIVGLRFLSGEMRQGTLLSRTGSVL